LPNTNIEQVVSRVLMECRLAGFHFNDSKYSDDDLTAGSLKPYQLFLIFNELLDFLEGDELENPELAWMIDASHNVKDPMEDLLQSLDAIALAYGQALLIDKKALQSAQDENDVTIAQEILQEAYRTDVRPLMAEARLRAGAALNPIKAYRDIDVRGGLIKERGSDSVSSGL
jgi:L-rhamnose isomerase / sugar isomerase